MNSGIYVIRHVASGNVYVGSSMNIHRRWCAHRCHLARGIHHSQRLQRAWNKYGTAGFEFEVLEHCNREELPEREQYYMDALGPAFNMSPLAFSTRGCSRGPCSEATKAKMSASRTGIKFSDAHKLAISRGHKFSTRNQENIQRLIRSNTGRKHGAEARANMALAQKGHARSKGCVRSNDFKRRVSAAMKGRPKSAETKERMAAAQRLRRSQESQSSQAVSLQQVA